MDLIDKKLHTAFGALKGRFGYKNQMEVPRIKKVVVESGVGKLSKDKKRLDFIEDRLAKITGQKSAPRGAKKAVASFKTRQGDTVGFQATLRGMKALDFMNKLILVALPRTRDFRGISKNSVDSTGNYTIGIREHIVFPETADEELRDVFGLGVSIATTAKTREEALAFFEHIGMPFAK